MKTRAIIMRGAATALLGTLAMLSPSYGQSDTNPPQYSSPAEKAQTQQLNSQGVNGTTQSPAALNGETGQPVQYNPQNGTPPDQQQQQYDQQMQQYRDQQQQYQNQRAQYQNQQQRYEHNLRWYDQARWNYDYPHIFAYEYGEPRLQPLYLIAEPSQQLFQAPIEGPNGLWVGRVRNVETAFDGRPARVEVALNRRVSVWVDPHHLRFDPVEHVVYTDLTRDMLWDMPGATIESAPIM